MTTVLKTSARVDFEPRVDLNRIIVEVSPDDAFRNTPVVFYAHSVYALAILTPPGATQNEITQAQDAARRKYPLVLKALGVGHFRAYGRWNIPIQTEILEKTLAAAARNESLSQLEQLFDERYLAQGQLGGGSLFQKSFYDQTIPFGGSSWPLPSGVPPQRLYYPYAIYDALSKVNYVPRVTLVATTEEIITETLTFSFSSVQSLAKYNTGAIELLYVSRFVNSVGKEIYPPQYRSATGEFVASAPCAGAIVVKYHAPYRLYKVEYSLPLDSALVERVHLGMLFGDPAVSTDGATIAQNGVQQIPPVKIAVLSKDSAQIADLPRAVWPPYFGADRYGGTYADDLYTYPTIYGATGVNSAAYTQAGNAYNIVTRGLDRNLTEKSRIVDQVNVASSSDPTFTIDVQRAKQVVLNDARGNPWTLNLTP